MTGRLYVVGGVWPGGRATRLVWASDVEEALLCMPEAWAATVESVDGSISAHVTLAPWHDFETDEEPRARIEIA
jgi:hypothetical protein